MKSISEILEECSRLTTKKARIEHLQQNATRPVLTILQFALHPGVVWDLPEGSPPYKPTEAIDQQARLHQEARKLFHFIKGQNNLHPIKRETMFVQVLESIDPTDAELLLAVKNKEIPYKGIDFKLVNEAFPGIFDVQY